MDWFPQTAAQWLALIGPLITLLIGFGYFAAPVRIFNHIKLRGADPHPEAFGEGRSTFAGFLISSGILGLSVKDPVVYALFAVAWGNAALGKLIHVTLDGGASKSAIVRLLVASALAGLCYSQAEFPPLSLRMDMFVSSILPAISAVITLVFAFLCFFLPKTSLGIMRLATIGDFPAAAGEIRGNLAGFYFAAALGVLLGGGLYALLFLGLGWLMTAFGRMISMLSDGTNNFFNWISLVFELALAAMPLAAAFGLLG